MTTHDPHKIPSPRTVRTIGTAAARKRDQLKQFEIARKRSIDKLNQARTELARAVAEAEARDRRRVRNQQMADQKQLKFILGGVMLEALRTQGPTAFAITPADLDRLAEKDRQLLTEVLTANAPPSVTETAAVAPDTMFTEPGVDVLL